MSVGALGGLLGSAAGAPLSQTTGSETERTQREGAVHERTANATERAENAAGIGTTEQDQEAGERDADGRRLWELGPDGKKNAAPTERQSKDPTGQSGTKLDLTG